MQNGARQVIDVIIDLVSVVEEPVGVSGVLASWSWCLVDVLHHIIIGKSHLDNLGECNNAVLLTSVLLCLEDLCKETLVLVLQHRSLELVDFIVDGLQEFDGIHDLLSLIALLGLKLRNSQAPLDSLLLEVILDLEEFPNLLKALKRAYSSLLASLEISLCHLFTDLGVILCHSIQDEAKISVSGRVTWLHHHFHD